MKSATPRHRALSAAVLLLGLATLAGSALWLLAAGEAGIRYSADHTDTVPLWHGWVPVLVGVALVRLVPWSLPARDAAAPAAPEGSAVTSRAVTPPDVSAAGPAEAGRPPLAAAAALTATALAFTVALSATGAGEPAYSLLKLLTLLLAPLLLFWWLRRSGRARPRAARTAPAWHGLAPAIPVAAWAVLTFAGPLAKPPSDFGTTVDPVTLVVTMAAVFLLNAVLEEVFYRRWLQSGWEAVIGAWPAIVLSSLLWASWHIAIQGRGDLPLDLASVFVNQGVTGLFLGYLWSRYRRMWPLLVVHGLVNSGGILLGLL